MPYVLDSRTATNYEVSSRKEWLLTNGIGGYSMGTVSGANQRRYHGLLVAATRPPIHRTVLLANVEAFVQAEGTPIGLSANQYSGAVYPEGFQFIREFRVGEQVEWLFKVSGLEISKQIAIAKRKNSVTIRYSNVGEKPFGLVLNPLVCHKFYHDNFRQHDGYPQNVTFPKDKTVIEHQGILLHLKHEKAQRVPALGWYYRFEHMRELERGLDPRDDLFCPCELRYELLPGESAVLIASDFDGAKAEPIPELVKGSSSIREQLVEAAKPFFVTSKQRTAIIAGYPWFADWGRDTMISIPGLCLKTGRADVARKIILDYAGQMLQGLIPNRFVESGEEPEYNTADATLWFANAIHCTLVEEWDQSFAESIFKKLFEMYEWHERGTLFGIKVDPADGLLTQGEAGVQLTWMDAKIDGWVVTPRHGKPVEVNGLWINALRILEWLAQKLAKPAERYSEAAAKAETHFDAKFWSTSLGHYLDTADPDDGSLRPNQLIAMSLPFGPATGEHAKHALQVISKYLLTENGIRTLGPEEPNYRGRFKGALPELDMAYHQGTVWPWLLGPYVTALVKLTGDKAEAKRILRHAKDWLQETGLGGISEVYDGDKPRTTGGCPWQAWSVAEVLRAWVDDVGGK